jgi:tetratricopeptide (TPR) repeat protein
VVAGGVIDQAVLALRTTRPGLVQLDGASAEMLGARFQIDRQGEALFLRGESAWDEGAPRLLGNATPHVGCGREMSMLEGMLSGCAEESVATAVIVSGPAGSGKSRLWQELRDKIRQRGDNVEILWGRGDSLGAGSPFWIIGDAIRRAAGVRDTDPLASRREKIADRIGRRLEGAHRARVIAFLGEMAGTPFPDTDDATRAAAGNAILMGDSMRAAWEDWLAAECGARPVLLALEDLHRGDAASLGLIDSTLRNLHDRPLMVLALARPEIHAHFPGFWGERAVQTIQLGPLARRASERLVTGALGEGASAGVVERIVERAAGNPFYLEELIRAVAAGRGEAFPDSVLATVEARLDAEGSEAKRILRAASVFGERFSRDGVAALLGGDAHRAEAGAWLRTLATRELVVPAGAPGAADDTAYVFRHALVRDATNAMLTEADRVLGHRLAAEWLEHSGHPENMAIAEHFRRGELPAQAAVWYRRAAERALEANDLTAALERAELGVGCGAADQELGCLRLVQAEAHVWRGELAEGEVHGGSAIGLLHRGTAAWFRAVTQTITAAGKLGGFERVEGWGELAAAIPFVGASSAQIAAQIACLSWIATHLIFGGRYVTAAALLSILDRIAERPATIEPQAIALLYQVRAIRASVTGDLGAGLDGFKAALAAFEQTGDERNASAVRSNLGFIFAELGDFAGAEEALRASLAAADRMGLRDLSTAALHNLGRVLAYRGRVDEARTVEQRALDAYTRQGDPRMAGSARAYLAQIAVLAGDHDAAEREARIAVEVLSVAPPLRAGALSVLARALLAKGRLADAFAAAKEAFSQLESLGSLEEGEAAVRLVYAEVLAARGAEQEFAMAIVEAHARLLSRAAKISDPVWRERFLTGVPENARTIELSRVGALPAPPERGRW